jgi:tRNASer (uridine44-2'-O)-methyltransferase
LDNDTLQILVDEGKKILMTFDFFKVTLKITDSNSNWLKFVLVEKFQNWLENCEESDKKHKKSIHLMNAEEYQQYYSELKDKYGLKLVEIWPENTDPLKFVYEDLAIAAYLILLWKKLGTSEDDNKKQSFVDLGCGNGLLVYILSMEGHPGCGIDLRKRKIWDFYPKNVDLKVQSIVPSDKFLFPETNWIIGNHSDELSPWIPVIAARSSYTTNFFLLPCCSYELDGKKYARKSDGKSQYLEYIDFLTDLTQKCRFEEVQIDRLKIPSTKRICIIGTRRNFPELQFDAVCNEIQDFIDSKCANESGELWASDFKPRESVEKVRNCTTVDRSISLQIVKIIFDKILAKDQCFLFDGWNCGGELEIPEAVSLIDREKLLKLKSECGGLQTLLKNNYQVFQVYQGKIKIRHPEKLEEKKLNRSNMKNELIKSKPCFFFQYHPQGCPLKSQDCCYIH